MTNKALSTIALIAHDGKKDDMIRFARAHWEMLARFRLIARGTTGEQIQQATGLAVERMRSGLYDIPLTTNEASARYWLAGLVARLMERGEGE